MTNKESKTDAPAPLPAADCSRFSESRIEELLHASNELSEGDEIAYEDARDLALYALDELERVRNTYQARLMELANTAMRSALYPANAGDEAPERKLEG